MNTSVIDNVYNNAHLNEIEDIHIGGNFTSDIYNKYDKTDTYNRSVKDDSNFLKYFFISMGIIMACIMAIILKGG